MRMHLSVGLAILVLSGARLQAQSLGDIARQEEARRKSVASSGKVYTNDSLRADGTQPTPVTTGAASEGGSSTPAPPAPASAAPEAPADPKKTEKYWRDRVSEERDKLSRAETFAEALQSRINGLTADFSGRDDPFQRNQISGDRQKALAELDRVRKEIDAHTKAIAAIQEDARKSGVPAGWAR